VNAERAPVWTTSFLDLCLVLLGFFVMLHAVSGQQSELMRGLNATFGTPATEKVSHHRIAPRTLFQPDEALFRPGAAAALVAIGHDAARDGARVRIESVGTDPATNRFDGWELAAARTAAVARTIRSGGLSEKAIEISLPGTGPTDRKGQQITVSVTTPRS